MFNTLPMDIINSPDFQDFLQKLEQGRPAMFMAASAEEILHLYSGKISSHQLIDAMEGK